MFLSFFEIVLHVQLNVEGVEGKRKKNHFLFQFWMRIRQRSLSCCLQEKKWCYQLLKFLTTLRFFYQLLIFLFANSSFICCFFHHSLVWPKINFKIFSKNDFGIKKQKKHWGSTDEVTF
jgi:hypothetical protein